MKTLQKCSVNRLERGFWLSMGLRRDMEFEPASLGGRQGPAATSEKWDTQLYGIAGKYAFGGFTFDTAKPDPEVTFKLIGQDADVIYEITLKRSELTA